MHELPPATIAGQAEFLRAGGYTRRYHGWRTLKDDPVGLHSYNVANLVILLFPDCRKELVVAAVRHDSPEWVTGDPPSTAKRRVPGLKEALDDYERDVCRAVGLSMPTADLIGEEKRQLKIADYLDGMMYCIQERRMGNTYIDPVFRVFHEYVQPFLWSFDPVNGDPRPDYPTANELFCELQKQWEDITGDI